jgi:hypothetical protein
MGGTLTVKSEVGFGSIFTVKLKAEIEQNKLDKLRVIVFFFNYILGYAFKKTT